MVKISSSNWGCGLSPWSGSSTCLGAKKPKHKTEAILLTNSINTFFLRQRKSFTNHLEMEIKKEEKKEIKANYLDISYENFTELEEMAFG